MRTAEVSVYDKDLGVCVCERELQLRDSEHILNQIIWASGPVWHQLLFLHCKYSNISINLKVSVNNMWLD